MLERFIETDLAPVLRPVLGKLAVATLAAVLSGLAILCALWCLALFVANLTIGWVVSALSLWIAAACMASAASWLSHHAEAHFSARLRREVASHLTQLPTSTLARQGSDALRRLVSEDIAALHHVIAHLPSEIATFVVVPLASIMLMVALAGPVALLALLPGILAAVYYLLWIPRTSARHGSKRMQVMGEITTAVDDYARGIRINRIYSAESGALTAYHDAANRFTSGMVDWVAKVATPAAVAVALLQAATTFAIAYTVVGRHDVPSLAAALFFSLAIVTPALRLGHGLDYVAAGRAAADRLAAILREPALPSGDALLQDGAPILDVQNAFLTIDGRNVLNGLSHCFTPGTLTAITGPSGAGKTTLLRALAGLESLDSGSISLAGINISTLNTKNRHLAVQFIPQGGEVLSTTVRENLALSAPNASDAQMIEALTQAQIDVRLDVDAEYLSGGERQRVGLARAFLAPTPVILLDEPTSALDESNATHLMLALLELARNRNLTLVMVTHDLALAARANARLELKPVTQPEVQQ